MPIFEYGLETGIENEAVGGSCLQIPTRKEEMKRLFLAILIILIYATAQTR